MPPGYHEPMIYGVIVACAFSTIVTIVAATVYLARKLSWLHDVLIPWIYAINEKLGLPKGRAQK